MIQVYTYKEFEKELVMFYDELVYYLKEKYGSVPHSYFSTPACISKSQKITRTADGLYVHHIAEDKYINLSEPRFAKLVDFKYQLSDQLIYCNYFEHMLLHLAIVKEADPNYIIESGQAVGIGGLINFLIPEANLFYKKAEIKGDYEVDSQSWRKNCHMCLRENKEIYNKILFFLSKVFLNPFWSDCLSIELQEEVLKIFDSKNKNKKKKVLARIMYYLQTL